MRGYLIVGKKLGKQVGTGHRDEAERGRDDRVHEQFDQGHRPATRGSHVRDGLRTKAVLGGHDHNGLDHEHGQAEGQKKRHRAIRGDNTHTKRCILGGFCRFCQAGIEDGPTPRKEEEDEGGPPEGAGGVQLGPFGLQSIQHGDLNLLLGGSSERSGSTGTGSSTAGGGGTSGAVVLDGVASKLHESVL